MAFQRPKIEDVLFTKHFVNVVHRVKQSYLLDHMDGLLSNAKLEERLDPLSTDMIFMLRTAVLKSHDVRKETYSISVPATWWDHLKEDLSGHHNYIVRWIAQHLAPVEYRTESKEFEVGYRLCPHNNSYLQDDPQVHISFMTWEDADV